MMIGIAGQRGSGKDRFADAFVPVFERLFATVLTRMRFAQPLLDDLSRFGFVYPDTLEGKESPYGSSGINHRRVVTSYSDWAKGVFGEEVFFKRSEVLALQQRFVLFTDVRLPREVALIRKHGILIHIISDNIQAPTGHGTEAGVPINYDTDFTIYNMFRNHPEIFTPEALIKHAGFAAQSIHKAYTYAQQKHRV